MATIPYEQGRPASAPVRTIPSYFPFTGGMRILPLLLAEAYLCVLLGLFLIWPINWQIFHASDWWRLIAYILACYMLIAVGYMLATGPVRRVAEPFKHTEWVIIGGAIAAAILVVPISRVYTGRWPWEVMSVIGQQGEAYRTLQEQLELTTGQRGLIAIIRAVFSPLTFAVVPLGLVHWTRLTWFQRSFVVLSVLVTILISLLRGTDREFADLAIVAVGALLIAVARSNSETSGAIMVFVRRYWPVVIVGVLFVTMAASLFSERKSARLGNVENRTVACVNTSNICANLDAPLIRWMPQEARFATSLFILSTASGFYGLEIAMEKEFKPTYGVGHSPAAIAVYELLTGDTEMARRTYTYRNGFDGWSELNYWSTLMAWLANDLGFPGTLVAILFIGWIFGRTWRSATVGNSDAAAVLFCALMITMFYLTANNQLFGSYDGYFVAAAWAFMWLIEKRHQVVMRLSS